MWCRFIDDRIAQGYGRTLERLVRGMGAVPIADRMTLFVKKLDDEVFVGLAEIDRDAPLTPPRRGAAMACEGGGVEHEEGLGLCIDPRPESCSEGGDVVHEGLWDRKVGAR